MKPESKKQRRPQFVTSPGTYNKLMIFLLCLSPSAMSAADNWNVDGEHGELHVFGQLAEAACRLDMTSAFQQVSMGNILASDMTKPGSQGTPVSFQLWLKDCLRTAGSQRNNRTGNLSWSEHQPVVSVAFLAIEDVDTPGLVRINGQGVSGVGLRLLNEKYQPLYLGSWNSPHFVGPGQGRMTFYVVPERTSAPLRAGMFRATITFNLNYE